VVSSKHVSDCDCVVLIAEAGRRHVTQASDNQPEGPVALPCSYPLVVPDVSLSYHASQSLVLLCDIRGKQALFAGIGACPKGTSRHSPRGEPPLL
jgi:hypothetical protein